MNAPNDRPNQKKLPAKLVTYSIGLASTGREQIGILFEVTEGELQGRELTWFGSFTPESFPITVKTLRELGWSAQNVGTLRTELRLGTLVQLVCEPETFNGRERLRVKFVNRRGVVRMDQHMTKEQRSAFSKEVQEMLDKGLGEPRQAGTTGGEATPEGRFSDDDDIPF
jgi:hypothetical protein